MKKILVTGKNSYIGNSFANYCKRNNVDFEIDKISVRGNDWKNKDFSKYDVLLNVAGIAHRKETKKNRHLYYEVNRDLAFEIAQKAKDDGVKHLIFMSTMSVYGISEGFINKKTVEKPISAYGKSKLEAENKIVALSDSNFITSIIRPPMIYGPASKGNYKRLSKLSKTIKIFPNIENQRSMLFIDNLSEFLSQLIIKKIPGYFYPQNKEYINTYKMVKEISQVNNKTIAFTSIFNPIITLLNINVINKVFGNLVYDKNLSSTEFEYQIYGFKKSIAITESNHF